MSERLPASCETKLSTLRNASRSGVSTRTTGADRGLRCVGRQIGCTVAQVATTTLRWPRHGASSARARVDATSLQMRQRSCIWRSCMVGNARQAAGETRWPGTGYRPNAVRGASTPNDCKVPKAEVPNLRRWTAPQRSLTVAGRTLNSRCHTGSRHSIFSDSRSAVTA